MACFCSDSGAKFIWVSLFPFWLWHQAHYYPSWRLTVMSELFWLLGQLCSQCKQCALVLEWKWAEITCFIPASEHDWCVYTRWTDFYGETLPVTEQMLQTGQVWKYLCSYVSVFSWIDWIDCLTLWLFFHHIFFFFRPVGRNSPTLVILRDTCVFTLERSLSAVGTATRLSPTLQPVKLMRKLTGDLCGFNLAPLLFLTFACPLRSDRFTYRN